MGSQWLLRISISKRNLIKLQIKDVNKIKVRSDDSNISLDRGLVNSQMVKR